MNEGMMCPLALPAFVCTGALLSKVAWLEAV